MCKTIVIGMRLDTGSKTVSHHQKSFFASACAQLHDGAIGQSGPETGSSVAQLSLCSIVSHTKQHKAHFRGHTDSAISSTPYQPLCQLRSVLKALPYSFRIWFWLFFFLLSFLQVAAQGYPMQHDSMSNITCQCAVPKEIFCRPLFMGPPSLCCCHKYSPCLTEV